MWLSGLYSIKGRKKLEVEEFRHIFLEYYPELCLYASKFTGNIDAAKDIVQDVLAHFWIDNEKLLNKNRIKYYLYKSVKNKSLNFTKREKKQTSLDQILNPTNSEFELASDADVISSMSFENLKNDLEKAVNEMPAQQQRIFRMSRFQQMKHKEIAEELEISPKTVETHIYRSLGFLSERLRYYLEDR